MTVARVPFTTRVKNGLLKFIRSKRSEVSLEERRKVLKTMLAGTAAIAAPLALGASLSACSAKIASGINNTGGKFVELSYSDVIALLKDANPRFKEADILKLKEHKSRPLVAKALAKHIITNLYRGDAIRNGDDKLIAEDLSNLAANQITAVITRLAKTAGLKSAVNNFKDNLSKDQWAALEIRFDKKQTDMSLKFGGKIVLKGLYKSTILELIKKVKNEVPRSAAAAGKVDPEVVVCDVDDKKSSLAPYAIKQGEEKTLYLRGEMFHVSSKLKAKIKLNFGKGVEVVNSKATPNGFEATVRVSKTAALGPRTLTVLVDNKKVEEVPKALTIKPAPSRVAKVKVKKGKAKKSMSVKKVKVKKKKDDGFGGSGSQP